MKMFWFFTATTEIPWAFKLCGIFQACCDAFLGIQYLMYGNGETPTAPSYPMASNYSGAKPKLERIASGVVDMGIPTGRRTPNEL